MVSLKKILSLPRFSDLKVLTNKDLLTDRMIQSVEITETPDVANYIPKNVLVLSTCMAFEDKQDDLIPWIDSLIQAEAIGLAIKINRFLKKLDPEVIAYANKKNFPILFIPDNYQLGALLHQIMNIVLNTEREEIEFALDIQKNFSNLLIQDASNDLLVNEFSRMIESPIILLDPFKEIIAKSRHLNSRMNQPDYYLDLLIEQVEESERDEGSFIIELENGEKKNISLIKIQMYKYFPHYLIVFDSEQLPFPTSVFTIDQAALVFQFNLFKNEKVNESLYANEAYFFEGLIDIKVKESYINNWFQVSKNYGYSDSNYYQVINVQSSDILNEQPKSLQSIEKALLSYQWLRENIKDYFTKALVIWRSKNQESIILLQEKADNIEEKLKTISNKLDQIIDSQLIFSVGHSFPNWEKIEQSYIQANLANNERTDETIIFYRDKGMYELFNDMNSSEIIYFCQKTLKDFAYPDEDNVVITDLRNTLDVYLANQCEITKTANLLFIHRNTVKYRINRCEEILGLKVNAPEESLNLRLALNLSKLDL